MIEMGVPRGTGLRRFIHGGRKRQQDLEEEMFPTVNKVLIQLFKSLNGRGSWGWNVCEATYPKLGMQRKRVYEKNKELPGVGDRAGKGPTP